MVILYDFPLPSSCPSHNFSPSLFAWKMVRGKVKGLSCKEKNNKMKEEDRLRKENLQRIILNLKAIQFACMSAAQINPLNAIVNIDNEAQDALDYAIKELEKKL